MFLLSLLSIFTLTLNLHAEEFLLPPTKVIGDQSEGLSPAINEYSSDKQVSRGNSHLSDLLESSPGVNIAGGTHYAKNIQFRGIGERSFHQGAPNRSHRLIVDGVDWTSFEDLISFSLGSNIRIHRGPLNDEYGITALSGAIIIDTLQQTDNQKFQFQQGLGSQSLIDSSLLLHKNLKEKTSFHLSTQYKKSDGFGHNAFLKKSTNKNKNQFISAKIKHSWTPKFISSLKFTFADSKNGYDSWSLNNNRTTLSDHPGSDNKKVRAYTLKNEYLLSSKTKLNSISHYKSYTSTYSYDEDWGNNTYWNAIAGWNKDYNYFQSDTEEGEHYSQKISLQNKNNRYLTNYGLLFNKKTEAHKIYKFKDEILREQLISSFTSFSYSPYFVISKDIGLQNFKASLNFNYTDMSYNDSQSTSFKPNDTNWSLDLSYKKYLKKSIFHSRISKNYKNGGFNIDPDTPSNKKIYNSEQIIHLETGLSQIRLPANIMASFTAFYYWRPQQQIHTSSQKDPLDPSTYNYYNDNAQGGRGYGLEAQLNNNSLQKIHWSLHISYLKTRLGDFNFEGKNLKGREQAHAPNFQSHIKLRYKSSLNSFIGLNYISKSAFYFSNSHNQKSKAYGLFNANLGYQYKDLQFSFYIKNILNKDYPIRGFYFANEPPHWNKKLYTQLGKPRHFGLFVKWTL